LRKNREEKGQVEQDPRNTQERALRVIRATLIPGWLTTSGFQRLVWTIRIAIVIGVLVLIGSAYDKTLWDWLTLLIVPAVIAAGGIWFNQQQRERELEIADQRAQDEALRAYLDQMSQLLTDKERPLHRARSPEPLSTVAWARTKTVLRRMDATRRGIVVRFVYESRLIYKGQRVFDLAEASLRGADLRESWLEYIDLEGTDLRGADFRGAHLRGANLRGAKLSSAKLRGADLTEVDMSVAQETNQAADLTGADLTGANLTGTKVTKEQLDSCQSFSGATMPNGQKYED
jgi:hypothetical protein